MFKQNLKRNLMLKIISLIIIQGFLFTGSTFAYPNLGNVSKTEMDLRVGAAEHNDKGEEIKDDIITLSKGRGVLCLDTDSAIAKGKLAQIYGPEQIKRVENLRLEADQDYLDEREEAPYVEEALRYMGNHRLKAVREVAKFIRNEGLRIVTVTPHRGDNSLLVIDNGDYSALHHGLKRKALYIPDGLYKAVKDKPELFAAALAYEASQMKSWYEYAEENGLIFDLRQWGNDLENRGKVIKLDKAFHYISESLEKAIAGDKLDEVIAGFIVADKIKELRFKLEYQREKEKSWKTEKDSITQGLIELALEVKQLTAQKERLEIAIEIKELREKMKEMPRGNDKIKLKQRLRQLLEARDKAIEKLAQISKAELEEEMERINFQLDKDVKEHKAWQTEEIGISERLILPPITIKGLESRIKQLEQRKEELTLGELFELDELTEKINKLDVKLAIKKQEKVHLETEQALIPEKDSLELMTKEVISRDLSSIASEIEALETERKELLKEKRNKLMVMKQNKLILKQVKLKLERERKRWAEHLFPEMTGELRERERGQFSKLKKQLAKSKKKGSIVFFIDERIFHTNPSAIFALLIIKEQLGEMAKFVLAPDKVDNAEEFYERIYQATLGNIDLAEGFFDLVVSREDSAEEAVQAARAQFGAIRRIAVIGNLNWIGEYERIPEMSADDCLRVFCELGKGEFVTEGYEAVLLAMRALLAKEDILDAQEKDPLFKHEIWNKKKGFFRVGSRKIREEHLYAIIGYSELFAAD